MIDLELKDLKISKTFSSGVIWFCIADRLVLIPEIDEVSIYINVEDEIFTINIIGTHGISLSSIDEAKKVSNYLGVRTWSYAENGNDIIEMEI